MGGFCGGHGAGGGGIAGQLPHGGGSGGHVPVHVKHGVGHVRLKAGAGGVTGPGMLQNTPSGRMAPVPTTTCVTRLSAAFTVRPEDGTVQQPHPTAS